MGQWAKTNAAWLTHYVWRSGGTYHLLTYSKLHNESNYGKH